MSSPNTPSPERIMQMAWGYAPPIILETAIRNRVFDVLDNGPLTLSQVAAETAASERGLRALMNALVSLQFLSKKGDTYATTPESSAFLVSGKPSFQGGMLLHTSGSLLPKWLELDEIVKTGEPARAVNQQPNGSEFFREFVEALFPSGYPGAAALAQHLNVEAATEQVNVLDIAAGSGVWGVALAHKSKQVCVTAVDWPDVIPVTQRVVQRSGVAEQFRFIAGDILEAPYGSNYHVATLGHILHSEGEARSRELIAKVYEALAPGGAIAIAEWIANEERTGPPAAMLFAVNMLVNTDEGDTFTFSEMSSWLAEAGFETPELVEAPAPSPLIVARKPA